MITAFNDIFRVFVISFFLFCFLSHSSLFDESIGATCEDFAIPEISPIGDFGVIVN